MATVYGYDTLDVLGGALGVYVVLAALVTLIGQPWQYSGGTAVMVVRALGTLVALLVGVALCYLVFRVD